MNAQPLNVVKDENGRMHLMRREFESMSANELCHVIIDIIDILDSGAVDSYLMSQGGWRALDRAGQWSACWRKNTR